MADVLRESHGMELTLDESEADVILINTCSIREKAQEKVFSQLGRWKQHKKDGKPVLIGVGGCVASQEGEAIVKRAPYVDLVFGPQTLHRLPERIEQVLIRITSASDSSRVSSMPCDSRSTSAILAESYSFIWQPWVLMKSLPLMACTVIREA
jgi:tRNA A37 methylthiotransferase MiaB